MQKIHLSRSALHSAKRKLYSATALAVEIYNKAPKTGSWGFLSTPSLSQFYQILGGIGFLHRKKKMTSILLRADNLHLEVMLIKFGYEELLPSA